MHDAVSVTCDAAARAARVVAGSCSLHQNSGAMSGFGVHVVHFVARQSSFSHLAPRAPTGMRLPHLSQSTEKSLMTEAAGDASDDVAVVVE